jgi:8-oxo-dGTP pyrophosphatase MutT (NUDIX family)
MITNKKALGTLAFWIGYPGIYFLLRNSHRARIVINVGDKVLFVKSWLGPNNLELPGGGIKSQESSINAAVREVLEETNLVINPKDLKLIANNFILKELGIKYFADLYGLNLPKIAKTSSKQLEIVDSVWLPYKKVLNTKLLSKNTSNIINLWISNI